jgi:tetratricopeptide (TPR) repeat protein
MESVCCSYCENLVHREQPFCGRCGGRPLGETATEQALSGLRLAERLIHQRVWFGLEKEIAAIKARLDEGDDDDYSACEPALNRLVEAVQRIALLEPDIPRVIKVARLVFGLVRGRSFTGLHDKIARLEQFTKALQESDQKWSGGRPPSPKKALAWLAEQAEQAGMTAEEAHESVYETPERWPVVAATVDPDASRLVFWKVEVAQAEAEFKAKNYGKARNHLADVLAREQDCARAHEVLAQILQALGQTSQAIDQFRAAARTGNASPTAWNNLAWYLANGNALNDAELDEALWAAHRALALAPRSTCWDTLALVRYLKGDLPDAIAAAREAIRLDPDRSAYRERMRTLCDALPSITAPSGPAPTKQDPNSATVMPGVGGKDPGATSLGMSEKDIFEDTDFSLEVDALDSDHDDRTVQIDHSSDFDLEEAESASEVFALDEDNVDQNAATAMGAALAEDESGEFSADEASGESASGWDVECDSGVAPPTTAERPSPGSRPRSSCRTLTVTDRVQFSVTAPATLEPGNSYALDVWAYVDAQRVEMMARARESQGTDDIRVKTKDGVVIARGVVLTVRLAIPTLEVADPEDVIAWDGKIGNATFPVSVPAEARTGPHAGTATFHVENLKIAKLHFVLEVGRRSASVAPLAAHEVRCKRAFASYASEDRDEVVGRLQGIMKVLPDLDLFFDVLSLRSGERWEERLYQEIARRDTLYLFWSLAASRSPWVEREWRTALALRGVAGIDPVPLVSPEEVLPPPELAQHLHFNDWILAFTRGRRVSRSGEIVPA